MPTPQQLQVYLDSCENADVTLNSISLKEAIKKLSGFSYADCECCNKPNQWVNGQGLCMECFVEVWEDAVNEAADDNPHLIQLQANRILFNDFYEHVKNENH